MHCRHCRRHGESSGGGQGHHPATSCGGALRSPSSLLFFSCRRQLLTSVVLRSRSVRRSDSRLHRWEGSGGARGRHRRSLRQAGPHARLGHPHRQARRPSATPPRPQTQRSILFANRILLWWPLDPSLCDSRCPRQLERTLTVRVTFRCRGPPPQLHHHRRGPPRRRHRQRSSCLHGARAAPPATALAHCLSCFFSLQIRKCCSHTWVTPPLLFSLS